MFADREGPSARERELGTGWCPHCDTLALDPVRVSGGLWWCLYECQECGAQTAERP